MLAKQVWWLFQQTESLVGMVLQTKYKAGKIICTVHSSSRASFMWRSLLLDRDLFGQKGEVEGWKWRVSTIVA